jgi:peptidyl-prolyl cis-trans isomerase C
MKLVIAAVLALSTVSAFAQNAALVNGKPIPSSRVDAMIKQVTTNPQNPQKDTPELRAQVRQELINREIFSQEAEKRGLSDTPEFKSQMDSSRQQLLIRALVNDFVNTTKPSDAELLAAYNEQKKGTGDKEYRARHILVEKEEDAKKIIADLKKGKKFEDLAKQSKDPGSAANGGDLDWSAPGNYVPEFSTALTKLEKGKFTDVPVKSQFGFHVIRLDDVRPTQFPPLEQVKPQLSQMVTEKKLRDFQDDLSKKAKVE